MIGGRRKAIVDRMREGTRVLVLVTYKGERVCGVADLGILLLQEWIQCTQL